MNREEVKQRLLENERVGEKYKNPLLGCVLARAVVEHRRAFGFF